MTTIGSWNGTIRTEIWYDETLELDRFSVTNWKGAGVTEEIASGVLKLSFGKE